MWFFFLEMWLAGHRSCRDQTSTAAAGRGTPAKLQTLRLPAQNGVLGLGHEKDQQPRRPTRLRGLSDVRQISAGWKHNTAVTDEGLLYTWGWGGSQGGRWLILSGWWPVCGHVLVGVQCCRLCAN